MKNRKLDKSLDAVVGLLDRLLAAWCRKHKIRRFTIYRESAWFPNGQNILHVADMDIGRLHCGTIDLFQSKAVLNFCGTGRKRRDRATLKNFLRSCGLSVSSEKEKVWRR